PYVKQNVYTSLDSKTGKPVVDPAKKPGTNKEADFCPSLWGGKNWVPAAFNPKTRLLYIPANENLCQIAIGRPVQYVAGQNYTGSTSNMYVASGGRPTHGRQRGHGGPPKTRR